MEKAGESLLLKKGTKSDGSHGGKVAGKDQKKELAEMQEELQKQKGSHGLYSYGLYSYGLHSYGMYSYGLYSYGLYSYGLNSYGLYSCG